MWKFYQLKALNKQPFTLRYLNPILTYMAPPLTGLCILENIYMTQFCDGLYTHIIFKIFISLSETKLCYHEKPLFSFTLYSNTFFLRKGLLCDFFDSFKAIKCSGLGGRCCVYN